MCECRHARLLGALEISVETGFGLCGECQSHFRCDYDDAPDGRCICPVCGRCTTASEAKERLDDRITRGWTDAGIIRSLLHILDGRAACTPEDALLLERAGHVQSSGLSLVVTPKGARVAHALARAGERHMARQLDFLWLLAREEDGSGFWNHVRPPDWLCESGLAEPLAPRRPHVWSITDKGWEEVKKRWPQG